MAARTRRAVAALCCVVAGCATQEPPAPARQDQLPGQIMGLLPAALPDRAGWAADIYAAFATQGIAPSRENVCAVLAVTEQESSFRADPTVPGLPEIAWREIDSRAERIGVPKFVVRAALQLTSPDGRTYSDRIDSVKTERELSETLRGLHRRRSARLATVRRHNPVRTGGPMQVGISFAEAHASSHPYPFPVHGSIRREVFARRGGMYFGIAHLLGYEAPYAEPLYRFADFNAGQYASRNAAFQRALSKLSGIPLVLDGDLLPPGAEGWDRGRDRRRGAGARAAAGSGRHRHPAGSRAGRSGGVRAYPPVRARLRAGRPRRGPRGAARGRSEHRVEEPEVHAQADHRVVCAPGGRTLPALPDKDGGCFRRVRLTHARRRSGGSGPDR